ncbi:MAG: ketoacyl-ACP synthase III [Myxococcales bacterium]|nr:MAG: ketoacyl-ACP synthase III [Myxococcales bacterium]
MSKLSAILGAGHYLPSRVVTNDDLAQMMPTTDEWIVQRTGIRERRFIEESGIGASDLALPAARDALARAGRDVKDVDAILFATLSPDVNFPGSGCFLAHKLGLPGVPALDVRNQCSGFLYSLSVADAWVRAGVYRTVLIVGAEVHSTGLEFNERGRDVAVLFGDGAGAVVVGESADDKVGLRSIELHADGVGARDLWLEGPASMYMPRLTHEMIDEGRVWPRMNGKTVFRWAADKMPEVARSVLGKVGWTPADVDLFVPHQANMRINQMVADRLGIPESKTVHNIERYGNTTAATIPIGLSESLRDGLIKPGSRVLMAAFGAGFTWAGATAQF